MKIICYKYSNNTEEGKMYEHGIDALFGILSALRLGAYDFIQIVDDDEDNNIELTMTDEDELLVNSYQL